SQWAIRADWVLNWLSATGGTACRKRWKNHSPRAMPAASLSRNRTTITTNRGDMEGASDELAPFEGRRDTSQGAGPSASGGRRPRAESCDARPEARGQAWIGRTEALT